ncbi:hypothetical protein QE152_g7163 [Popillia japonica]|uniref:Uncharacterized protein n=1 Tax=Popillia japonica TaxID=7064 RepID=A0AAW1MC64_POPJA
MKKVSNAEVDTYLKQKGLRKCGGAPLLRTACYGAVAIEHKRREAYENKNREKEHDEKKSDVVWKGMERTDAGERAGRGDSPVPQLERTDAGERAGRGDSPVPQCSITCQDFNDPILLGIHVRPHYSSLRHTTLYTPIYSIVL